MKISCAEFDQRFREKRLTIAFIGMSGMGKSYRAQQLANHGFKRVCCDDLITERMSDILPSADIAGLAVWMGQPYTNGYSEREVKYLQLEDEVTYRALEECSDNTVIDTTGSVIYLPEGTLQKLKERALILYLEANQGVRDEMFQEYMTDPKPIVWRKSFDMQEGESDQDALVRCYPKLLEFRAQRYRQLADVTLPYDVARDPVSIAVEFLSGIRSRLK